MTARHVQRFAAYVVKLLPTVAFAFVDEFNVVMYLYAVSALYVPCPICLCCVPNSLVLFKVCAFYKEMEMRVRACFASFYKHQPL